MKMKDNVKEVWGYTRYVWRHSDCVYAIMFAPGFVALCNWLASVPAYWYVTLIVFVFDLSHQFGTYTALRRWYDIEDLATGPYRDDLD